MSGSYEHIKTGFNDLDSIFELEGIERGSVVLVKSVPNANGLNFLLSIAQANLDSFEYITTTHRPQKVTDSLEFLGSIRSEIPEITPLAGSASEKLDEVVEGLELTAGSTVIVDHIHMFNKMEHTEVSETFQLISEAAERTESVFFLHELLPPTSELSSHPTIEYGSDYIFNITKDLTDEGIFQNIWIERLPIGQPIKESKKGTRIVKVDDTLERISTNAGGRI